MFPALASPRGGDRDQFLVPQELVNIIKEQRIFRGELYLTNIPYNINDTPIIAADLS